MAIDWSDKNSSLTPHFRVHEALWLPSWRVYHEPSEEEQSEIVKTANIMEAIREYLQLPINVHCWMRPTAVNAPGTSWDGKNYNEFVGSKASHSPHIFGRAVDFHVSGHQGPEECEKIRQRLMPKLEEWEIRMEDIDGAWIHIDTNPVSSQRFFKP